MSSKALPLKDFIKVLDNSKLTIYAENHVKSSNYDPQNEADIKRLCKDASILEFIKDTNPNYPSLSIIKNKRYNMGVITNVALKKNQIICEYLGELASLDKETTPSRAKLALLKNKKIKKNISSEKLKDSVENEIKRITHYAFGIKERSNINDSILAHNKRSLAGFINHNGTDPNVKSDIVKNDIYYKAARNIRKGEQLVIDYGPDYDYPDHLYYIPCTENHLTPGAFLAAHIKDYKKKPITLTAKQKTVLQTYDSYIVLPKIFYAFKPSNHKTVNDLDKLNIRLPLYTFTHYVIDGMNHQIYIPKNQLNITALMFACTLKDSDLLNTLIKDFKIDVFAKTSHDLDAMVIAIKSSESEEVFLRFAKLLIKKVVTKLDRIDSIGADHFSKTALHLLVDREWSKAIRLFDNPVFFDVVDSEGYDPLISALAYGKTQALAAMLKLKCIKKILYGLLFAEDETQKNYVLRRALRNIPSDKVNDCFNILLNAVETKHAIKKKLIKFFAKIN